MSKDFNISNMKTTNHNLYFSLSSGYKIDSDNFEKFSEKTAKIFRKSYTLVHNDSDNAYDFEAWCHNG